MTKPRRWILLDAPASAARLEQWLHTLSGKAEGILVRAGPGLDPLLLVAPIHASGFRFGLSLHLRDQNIVAQTSILQSALWLKIQQIFIGDPPPSQEIRPVGASNIPSFIGFARGITGDSIRYGVYNCLEHSRDEELLKSNLEAGASLIAVPEGANHRFARPGLDTWTWCRLRPGAPFQPPSGSETQLLDFTRFPEPAVDAGLKDWHERHGH